MYVLNIDTETNRILSVGKAIPGREYPGMILVEEKPDDSDGKWVSDYLYIDGAYVYDPEPRPETPVVEPTTEEILDALLGVE